MRHPLTRRKRINGKLVKRKCDPHKVFKPIPDNPQLLVNLDGCLCNTLTKTKQQYTKDDKLELTIGGKHGMYSFPWVQLMAYYEVDLPVQFRDRLTTIRFTDIQFKPTHSITCKCMVFDKPFELETGHRIIPNFTRYAINDAGAVLDLETNDRVVGRTPTSNKYITLSIYEPGRNARVSVFHHRLVGYAWVPNDNWYENNTINHKDGKKSNNSISNLEWVSYGVNNSHAHALGLCGKVEIYLTRDVETGDERQFNNLRELRLYTGHKTLDKERIRALKPGRLVSGRYEVKIKSDRIPWFWTNSKPQTIGRYHIRVKTRQGKTLHRFTSVEELLNSYPLIKYVGVGNSIRGIAKAFPKQYKGLRLVYEDQFLQGPYYAKNILTGEIITRAYSRDLATAIGCTKTTILAVIKNDIPRLIDNTYIVCSTANKSRLDEDYTHLIRQRCVYEVSHGDTTVTLDALRKVAKYLKTDRSVVKRLIRKKIARNGYRVTMLPLGGNT